MSEKYINGFLAALVGEPPMSDDPEYIEGYVDSLYALCRHEK